MGDVVESTSFCTKCGTRNIDSQAQCSTCGAPFHAIDPRATSIGEDAEEATPDIDADQEERPTTPGPTSTTSNDRVGPRDDPDKYGLEELRSQGAEGAVWKATLAVDGMTVPVAVKIILPGNLGDLETWKERWTRQAEVLRSLNHPGLVSVREVFLGPVPHAFGQADSQSETLYLVMNWVEGPSLNEWVARNPDRSAFESMQMIGGLAAAVDYLHNGSATGQPLLHRDIKPGNVIVTDAGAKLVDFGFVRAHASGQTMTMVGSPAYVAPEVATHMEYSPASDLFSLGATAFFALTGATLSIDDPLGAREKLDAVAGLEGRSDLHDHVLSMVHRDPHQRPASPIAWAQGIAALSVVGGGTVVGMSPSSVETPSLIPPEPAHPSPRRLGPLVVAAVGLAGVLAVGGFMFVAGRGNDDSAVAAAIETTTTLATPSEDTTDPTGTTATAAPAPTTVVVPDVTNLSEFDALQLLNDAGFASVEVIEEMSAETPGTVLAVQPAPGEPAEPGDPITVTVATEILVALPDLAGLTQDSAQAQLTGLGLIDVTVTESQSVLPVGTIVQQSPDAETEVSLDTPIALVVAIVLPMPDFTAMSLPEARDAAEALGAAVTTETIYDPDGEDLDILGQSPAVGAPMIENIVLQVAEGPSSIFLDSMPALNLYTSRGLSVSFGQGDINGERYIHALIYSNDYYLDSQSSEFNLSRDFDRLVAVVGWSDNAGASGSIRLEIFGDGEILYTADYELGQGVDDLRIDVTDVLRLEIGVTVLCCSSGADDEVLILGEIALLGREDKVAPYRG